MINNIILPTKLTTKIAIPLDEFQVFKDVFWSEKVYNFYIKNKTVHGKEVWFDVRSLRVNEFVALLNENKIQSRRIV